MTVMSPRLAENACSSAGTKTGKLSAIERLATPSTKQSATSNHGTKGLMRKFLARQGPCVSRGATAGSAPRRVSSGEVGHPAGLQRAAPVGQWRLCKRCTCRTVHEEIRRGDGTVEITL